MNYSVQYGQTIFDIVLATYGQLEYTLKLVQDNPFIESLDYDFDANPGAVISWDENFVIPAPPETDRNSDVSINEIAFIIATNGQSIYDLCLMTYGDLKYLYKLIQDNDIISPNDTNLSGKKITFNPTLIQDIGFYKHITNNNKVINTIENTKTGKAYNKSFNISFN